MLQNSANRFPEDFLQSFEERLTAIEFKVETGKTIQKFFGTPFGTEGFYADNPLSSYSSAFDEKLQTFFDSSTVSGAVCGLDLGTIKAIKKIRYLARQGTFAERQRIIGGVFDYSVDNIQYYQIGVVPSDALLNDWNSLIVNFNARYIRYTSPANSYGNIAEIEVYGFKYG